MNFTVTQFKSCKLVEVDFTEADLSNSVFMECELTNATFMQTNLAGADFRTAIDYNIDPRNNNLSKARFSSDNLVGLVQDLGLIIER